MNEFTFDMALVFALIPVVQGIVEALKIAFLPSRVAPLAAIALGVGGVYLTGSFSDNLGMMALTGVVIGLGAAGLYSFTKSNLERKLAAKMEEEGAETPVTGSDMGGDQKVVVPNTATEEVVVHGTPEPEPED
jgi:hexokinase